MGRSVEEGTPIRITRRIIARNMVIQPCDCVIQYNGNLKTERYDGVQVVLLSSLFKLYQGFIHEGDRKYGNGDISEGSLVLCRSKDDTAG